MNKEAYQYSLNYNLNDMRDEVMETRTIKRLIHDEDGSLKSTLYMKSDMKVHPIKEVDSKTRDLIGKNSFLIYSDEISFNQFEKYMDISCDLFSVDFSKLNLQLE
ncbi:C2 domain-containing protein [Virgibacillus dakarensis]|uniref:hypothetical protein n=1 Tax=Virgibacillus dakarensis TaxID=1917889 RepID=UPI000B449C53|nr:hypothetical protein [Virgibacillus dakarensis]